MQLPKPKVSNLILGVKSIQKKAISKNAQTTAKLHSFHTLAK